MAGNREPVMFQLRVWSFNLGPTRPGGAMDRRPWQYVNWHLEHGYELDGPVVTTFLILGLRTS